MNSKNLQKSKSNLLCKAMLPLLVVLLMLGASMNANAQKYKLTGTESQVSQATEITLNGSSKNKFYYLFRVDDVNEFHSVTFMVGQSYPLEFAPQTEPGKYVIYEFDEFKEMPFDFEKYNPEDGILQDGEAIVSNDNNN